MNFSRRHVIKGLTLTAISSSITARLQAAESPDSLPSLRKLAQGGPLIGVAIPTNFNRRFSPKELDLARDQFNSITPENCMKWQVLCPEEGVYRFSPADSIVKFAQKHDQKIVGHCLIFNRKSNYPDWVFRDGKKEADAKLVWKRIEAHVTKIMTRYKGKIYSWDVLNEFVEPHGVGYRKTDFTRVLGPDYPVRLFKLAAELDPKAKLTYNDYGIEKPERRKAILKFIRSLQDQGCRIDIIGSQSHLEIKDDIGENIDTTIKEFAKIGVKTAFTELDVDVIPRSLFWNIKTRAQAIQQNPYVESCPEEILQKQADVYHNLFKAALANQKNVDRVTLWGLNDNYSWLNHWPWKRVNHGLIFNRQAQGKPAFHAIADLLKARKQ